MSFFAQAQEVQILGRAKSLIMSSRRWPSTLHSCWSMSLRRIQYCLVSSKARTEKTTPMSYYPLFRVLHQCRCTRGRNIPESSRTRSPIPIAETNDTQIPQTYPMHTFQIPHKQSRRCATYPVNMIPPCSPPQRHRKRAWDALIRYPHGRHYKQDYQLCGYWNRRLISAGPCCWLVLR